MNLYIYRTMGDDIWIDDTWIMACDVALFPPNSPSMASSKNIKKRRRTYGSVSFHGDQGNSVGLTTEGHNCSTSIISGDSASVTSGDSTTSGDSAGVTSGDQPTSQECKRQARNRRENQRSFLISKRMKELGEVIRKANVVPLPPGPLTKNEVVTKAIKTIHVLQAKLQAKIQTHTQEGEMPAVVCG